MKKKLIFTMMALTMFMGSAKAITVEGLKNYEGREEASHIKVECTGEDTKNCALTLIDDAVQDIVISKDEKVTIDLAGHKLTNYCEGCSVIAFGENVTGASLTIKDSKGTGVITAKEGTNENIPLVNVAKGNTLLVEGGIFEVTKKGSTGIYNAGTLTINNITVKTKVDGAWGVTNINNATIKNGNFVQGANFSVIMNSGKMDIADGSFTVEGTGNHYSLLTNTKNDAGTLAKADLTITGGEFVSAEGAKILSIGKEDASTVVASVKGGLFTEKVDSAKDAISNYVTASNLVKLNDTFYVGEDTKEVVKDAKAGDTIDVLKGSYIEEEMPEGVIVKNSGDGEVTVNGVTVLKDKAWVTEELKEENQKDYNIVENVVYADNGEDIDIDGKIVKEEDETYKAMLKMAEDKGYKILYNMYDFWVKDEKTLTKPLTITFNLGESYNGKEAYIIHRLHDGTYQEEETEVKDGKISITVQELSPFTVSLREKEVVDNVQTSSMNIIRTGILTGISLIGIIVLVRKRKDA